MSEQIPREVDEDGYQKVTVAELVGALLTYPQDLLIDKDYGLIVYDENWHTMIVWPEDSRPVEMVEASKTEVICKRHRPHLVETFATQAEAQTWADYHRQQHRERDQERTIRRLNNGL